MKRFIYLFISLNVLLCNVRFRRRALLNEPRGADCAYARPLPLLGSTTRTSAARFCNHVVHTFCFNYVTVV